ncbi:MAG: TrkA family potassium uptake protein, partial [Chloroflexi bacterium]|nr:TrkA family potassium uptake protein [Chloroflexota bacterium]
IGGLAWQTLNRVAGLPEPSLAEAVFEILAMIFMQANIDFPDLWYLQIFFFIMPVVGLATLALGAADFGVLVFNRHARGEAWQVAVASTYSDHVVLVGLGHLGFRVARELHNLGQEVVAIERDPKADLLEGVRELGFPIIQDDALKGETLLKAGVDRASAVILCTSEDVLNLQMALKAHSLNPKARIIVRLFDDDFAREVSAHFGIDFAFSASALAAPAFAGAATQADISRPITLEGRVLSMGRFVVKPRSPLNGKSVGEFEHEFDISVVLHRRGEVADLHPEPVVRLQAGDSLAIFTDPQTLNRIARLNK